MKPLLSDIELDVQELKCILNVYLREPNAALREVLKRSILQMQIRLGSLLEQIEGGCGSETYSDPSVAAVLKASVPESGIGTACVSEEKDVCSETVAEPATDAEEEPALPEEEPVEDGGELPEDIDAEPQDEEKGETPAETDEAKAKGSPATRMVWGDRICPSDELRRSISLNDSFRFMRELFGGDPERMSRVLQQIGEMQSADAACVFLQAETGHTEDSEVLVELEYYVRRYFHK